MNTTIENLNIDNLGDSWTATVKLNNGQIIDIWHTAWPMTKTIVKEVLAISSDYPRFKKAFNPY